MSESKMRIAESITVDANNGRIWIDEVELPFYTTEGGPEFTCDPLEIPTVTLTFLTDNFEFIGRRPKPQRAPVIKDPEPTCSCPTIDIRMWSGRPLRTMLANADHYDPGCPIHDPIQVMRDIGAREMQAAEEWLRQHINTIYDDLGLTRETA